MRRSRPSGRRKGGAGPADRARTALGVLRLVNGAAALAAPAAMMRRLGVDPDANPAGVYILRLFGVRTALLGWLLLGEDDEARARGVREAVCIHTSDAAAAVLAGITGRLPKKTALTGTILSSVNVALAAAARRG